MIARNTAMTYKGKAVDVGEIGKELGVRYLLEGLVQPTSDRIRVNAHLIDAESGSHLWADSFDTDKNHLLQVEDRIVTRLARSLNIEAMFSEAIRLEPTRSSSGSLSWSQSGRYFGLKQCDQAIEWASRTIAVNPNYPVPYFDLVAALALQAMMRKPREALQRYLALDPRWPKTMLPGGSSLLPSPYEHQSTLS